MSPRLMTIAYRLWGHCEPIGWNCSLREAANAIDVDARVVGKVARMKGWGTRFRAAKAAHAGTPEMEDA